MTDKKVEIIKFNDKVYVDIYNDGVQIAQLTFNTNNKEDLETMKIYKYNWKKAGYRILIIVYENDDSMPYLVFNPDKDMKGDQLIKKRYKYCQEAEFNLDLLWEQN